MNIDIIFSKNHKISKSKITELPISSIQGNGFFLETENIIFINKNSNVSLTDLVISSNIYADIENDFKGKSSSLIHINKASFVYVKNIKLIPQKACSSHRTTGLINATSCNNLYISNIITIGSHLPFRLKDCKNININNIKISNYETGFWFTECNDVSITNVIAKNNPITEYNWWIGCNSTTKNNGKDTILASGNNYTIKNITSYYPIERTGYLNISNSVVENITSYNGSVKVSGKENNIIENVQVSKIKTIHDKPIRNRNISMLTSPAYESAFITYYSKNINVNDIHFIFCEGVDYIADGTISMSLFVENINISGIYAKNLSVSHPVYGFLRANTNKNSSNIHLSNISLENIGYKNKYKYYSTLMTITSDIVINNMNVFYNDKKFLCSDLIDISAINMLNYKPYIVVRNSNISLYQNINDTRSENLPNPPMHIN